MSAPHFIVEHRITFSLAGIEPVLQLLKEITMTQETIAQGLTDLSAQLTAATEVITKVGTETDGLLGKIADLEVVIASLSDVSPALQAAFDAAKAAADSVAAAAGSVDAKVADATPTP